MPKTHKQRSVGIQSTEFYNPEYQSSTQRPRIYKSAGFKNLLQKSVTIVPQEITEETDDLHLTRECHSRSVQADMESPSFFHRFKSNPHNRALPHPERQTPGYSRRNSDLVGVSNPGTSKNMATQSSISVLSQMNERYFQRHESSLVVVYGGGEKSRNLTHSLTSTPGHLYDSQGTRRLSDETVILIEDYHSYDERNVARRQELGGYRPRSFLCCIRRTRCSTEVLTRPLPLHPDYSQESNDELFCRICHEGPDLEPLMQPCLCKGSVGSVHAKCLKAWLEQSSTSRCELCNYPYSIRQTKKYSTCVSVRVFYKTVFDKRATAYDITSFVIITPLTLVGVVMCIQASLYSKTTAFGDSGFQMGYVTKVGMVMLSGTIIVAYLVWLYTLASFHFKSWKKWYSTCFDVEIIPVQMTSEERLQTSRQYCEEMRNRRVTSDLASPLLAIRHSAYRQSFLQRPTINNQTLIPQHDR